MNKKLIAASYIYRFTLSAAISKVKCLTSSDAEVFEFIAKNNTRIVQKTIMELDFPDEAKIGGIIRGEDGYIAHGNTPVSYTHFPLSAFYFNQFPTFFWVSNLVVIPAAGILIPLGISLLFFGGIPLIAVPLTKITGFVLQLVIQFLETVEKFPLSVLEFSVHRIELIFLYLTMFFSFIFIASKKKVFLKRAIFLLFILLSTSFAIKLTQFAKKQEITNSFRNYPGLYPVQEKGNDNLSQENFQ